MINFIVTGAPSGAVNYVCPHFVKVRITGIPFVAVNPVSLIHN